VVVYGLTVVEPLADVDVNVPGVMATVVAPDVAQLRVLLLPRVTLVSDALNELMVGGLDCAVANSPLQPAIPKQEIRTSASTRTIG
jgi:hypothetical protein